MNLVPYTPEEIIAAFLPHGIPEPAPKQDAAPLNPEPPEKLLSALKALDPSMGRDDWVAIMRAYKAGGGSFEDFDEWSSGGANYVDSADVGRIWDSFKAEGGTTARTLFKMAREAGWAGYKQAAKDVFKPIAMIPGENAPAAVRGYSDVEDLLETHIWIRGEDKFFDKTKSTMVSPASMNLAYGHFIEKGAVMTYISKCPRLQTADGFTFYPGNTQHLISDGSRTLINTWKPEGLTGRSGDISPWLNLVAIVAPDEEEREYLLDWLSFTVQHPEEKINHCIVLGGHEGIGKDLCLEPVLHGVGERWCGQAQGRMLEESYDDFAVEKKLVIFQEVKMSSQRIEDRLKPFTANSPTKISLRRLGRPQIEVPNLFSVLLTTNHREGLHLSTGPRRYFCIWSDEKKRDDDYYADLWNWYQKDDGQSGGAGIAHVVHFLRNRDLSSFSPGSVAPPTPWRDGVVQQSRESVSWELTALQDIVCGTERLRHDLVQIEDIRRAIQDHTGDRPRGASGLGPLLRDAGYAYRECKLNAEDGRKKYRLWAIRNIEDWCGRGSQDWLAYRTSAPGPITPVVGPIT